MDSMLVVVYSETGLARQVGRQLCEEHGWPMGEVQDLRGGGHGGLVRPLLDSVVLWRKPVAYEGPAPGDFRTVILVTTMRGGHLPAPMRAFLLESRTELRRVAIVSILKSEDATSAVAETAQLIGHAPIHNATFTAPEIEDGSAAARVTTFGDFLQPRSTAVQVPEGGQPLPAA